MPEPFDRLHMLNTLKEEDIRSTGYVVDTLEAALWCILQTEKNDEDYRECVLRAVNMGDDTDTVSAVTGGIAGLYYRIPGLWLCKIRNNSLIQDCLW